VTAVKTAAYRPESASLLPQVPVVRVWKVCDGTPVGNNALRLNVWQFERRQRRVFDLIILWPHKWA